MAFIQMADRRMDSKCSKRAHATYPEDDLLLETELAVAAVQRTGDLAVRLGILRNVGVEQVQRNSAHLRFPNPRIGQTSGKLNRNGERVVPNVNLRHQSQVGEIVHRKGFLLPSIRIQILPEVTMLVEQANPRQWQSRVAGRLQMI